MDKYYSFAGIEVVVSIPDKWMYEEERALEDFRVSQVKNPHYYQFEIVSELAEPEGELVALYPDYCVYRDGDSQIRYLGNVKQGWKETYIRVRHCQKQHFVQLKSSKYVNGVGVKSVLNALNFEYLLMENRSVILHASYIEKDGKALLFTAPSGTGKSTQADLWAEYRQAEIINGDRAVITIVDGVVYAAGIPFAGSSSYCKNRTLPLEAIVYLKQAPHNKIVELNGITAFCKVWEGCTVNNWNQENINKAIDLIQQIISKVPVYQLECTPDERAVIALEQMLKLHANECGKEQ